MSQPEPDPFAADSNAFEALLPDLLRTHCGRYALVKDRALVDVFDDMNTAYKAGLNRFGLERFFIGHIMDKPSPVQIPALYAGVIRACL
jgi:hypothetical protein